MKTDHLSDVQLALRPHRITGPVMAAFIQAAAIQPAAAIPYRLATPEASDELARLVAADIVRTTARGQWFDLRTHYAVEHRKQVNRAIFFGALALVLAIAGAISFRG